VSLYYLFTHAAISLKNGLVLRVEAVRPQSAATILDPAGHPKPTFPYLSSPHHHPEMALVASPPATSVWRDPNLLAAPSAGLLSSMGMLGGPGLHHHHHHHAAAAAAHHHGLLIAAGGGGLSPSGLDGGHTSPLLGHGPPLLYHTPAAQ